MLTSMVFHLVLLQTAASPWLLRLPVLTELSLLFWYSFTFWLSFLILFQIITFSLNSKWLSNSLASYFIKERIVINSHVPLHPPSQLTIHFHSGLLDESQRKKDFFPLFKINLCSWYFHLFSPLGCVSSVNCVLHPGYSVHLGVHSSWMFTPLALFLPRDVFRGSHTKNPDPSVPFVGLCYFPLSSSSLKGVHGCLWHSFLPVTLWLLPYLFLLMPPATSFFLPPVKLFHFKFQAHRKVARLHSGYPCSFSPDSPTINIYSFIISVLTTIVITFSESFKSVANISTPKFFSINLWRTRTSLT